MACVCVVTDERGLANKLMNSNSLECDFMIVSSYRQVLECKLNELSVIVIAMLGKPFVALEVVKKIRAEIDEVPILLISQTHNSNEAARAMELGVDDYCSSTVNPVEMMARIRKLIDRPPRQARRQIVVGPLVLDPEQKLALATSYPEPLPLRKREFEILWILAENPNRVVSRDYINRLTTNSDVMENTVDVHMSNLRKALQICQCADLIQTVHGFGYKLKI